MAAAIREIPLSGFLPGGSGHSGGAQEFVRLSVNGYSMLRTPGGLPPDVQVRSRSFTGSRDSTAQTDYLPLELALEPLGKVLDGLAFGAELGSLKRQAEARALFVTSFQSSFEPSPGWLRELYLALASRYGALDVAPALSNLALADAEREQVLALNALAAVTGWDARYDERAAARAVSVAAAAYAVECSH